MKRKGAKTVDPSPKKKPDPTISTDLRSKIGYKLQTLLNGISTDSAWFIRSRRQLYADLIQEPQYPEIIIDPTIVVKIEEADQCTEIVSKTPSPDFISSAKTRLTELLNKRQDSEKENSTSKSIPSSSVKSKQTANFTIPKRSRSNRKCIAETFNISHTDILVNQGQLQNDVIEVDAKTKKKTQTTAASKSSPSSVASQKQSQKSISTNRKIAAKHKSCINKNGVPITKHSNMVTRKSSSNSSAYCRNSQNEKVSTIPSSNHSNCDSVPMVSNESAFELHENVNLGSCTKPDDSITIDDCSDCISVAESSTSVSTIAYSETVFENVPCDPEVVVLEESQPAYEVINLDEEEEIKVIGQKNRNLHKCKQCGKTFFARSLLNFHLKMHGSDSVSSSLRSRKSCS